jgi:hypothetical protein
MPLSTSVVASPHGRETSDPSAGLLTETITGWTAPGMSAPLPFGTVHQGPASHAEHCCLWISFRRVSINLHKCSAGAVWFEKVQP